MVIAAGGTGGHLYPAVAVAEAVCERMSAEVVFVGTGRELEQRIVRGAGFQLEALSLEPVTGKGVRGLCKALVIFPARFLQAVRLIRRIRPNVVLGFGGFPSVLPVLAACLLGVPTILHEQNGEVGLANRLLSLVAGRVFAAPGARGFWRTPRAGVVHLNNPVRRSLRSIAPWDAPRAGEPLRLLVLGGSQGAMAVNSAVVAMLRELADLPLRIRHQTGASDYGRIVELYKELGTSSASVEPFIDDMAAAYGEAHLIISRAGAMSVAEVAESGRPAIFIPLPIARSHQRRNVCFLEEAGAAVVVEQGDGFSERLTVAVRGMLSDHALLGRMAAGAARVAGASHEPSSAVIATAAIAAGAAAHSGGSQ